MADYYGQARRRRNGRWWPGAGLKDGKEELWNPNDLPTSRARCSMPSSGEDADPEMGARILQLRQSRRTVGGDREAQVSGPSPALNTARRPPAGCPLVETQGGFLMARQSKTASAAHSQAVKARLDLHRVRRVEAWGQRAGTATMARQFHQGHARPAAQAQNGARLRAKVTKGRKAVRAGRAGRPMAVAGGSVAVTLPMGGGGGGGGVNKRGRALPMAPPKIGARTRKDLAGGGREQFWRS